LHTYFASLVYVPEILLFSCLKALHFHLVPAYFLHTIQVVPASSGYTTSEKKMEDPERGYIQKYTSS